MAPPTQRDRLASHINLAAAFERMHENAGYRGSGRLSGRAAMDVSLFYLPYT